MIETTLARGTGPEGRPADRLAARLPQTDVLALWREVFDAAHAALHSDPRGTDHVEVRDPAWSVRHDGMALTPSAVEFGNARERNEAGLRHHEADVADAGHGAATETRTGEWHATPSQVRCDGAAEITGSQAEMPAAARGMDASRAECPPVAVYGSQTAMAASMAPAESGCAPRGAQASTDHPGQLVVTQSAATLRKAAPAGRAIAASPPRSVRSTPDELPAAESVRVFQDAAGLQVVVRHVCMSADSAVWCAMETARQLTGDRRALQHVTLNGRTVYASSDDTREGGADAVAIVFSC